MLCNINNFNVNSFERVEFEGSEVTQFEARLNPVSGLKRERSRLVMIDEESEEKLDH